MLVGVGPSSMANYEQQTKGRHTRWVVVCCNFDTRSRETGPLHCRDQFAQDSSKASHEILFSPASPGAAALRQALRTSSSSSTCGRRRSRAAPSPSPPPSRRSSARAPPRSPRAGACCSSSCTRTTTRPRSVRPRRAFYLRSPARTYHSWCELGLTSRHRAHPGPGGRSA